MKRNTNISEKSQIAQKILKYLAEHPGAQDTLEGIVEWWLLEQDIRYQIASVKEALAELVKRGDIVESRPDNSRSQYRLGRPKTYSIQTHNNQINKKFH